ncbi:uncharacterized protein LOC114128826 [Aphis gossypii]|uniref:uncharacterized protein LOC114128826 n=1 Tax=Aphis gossypii TaxID=80765 RepID=UPI0021591FA7|nr:uncharacterized protein LOC114128826 [Aphis gossypii]
MKTQTIKIDFTAMLYTGILYTGLVISGWLLIRLTIACFKLPSILNAVEESKNKTKQSKRTSTLGTTVPSEGENEDLSSVQYFNTLMKGTCNDSNILKQSVIHYTSNSNVDLYSDFRLQSAHNVLF